VRLDLATAAFQLVPPLPVPTRPHRPDRLRDLADQLIGQLRHPAITGQPSLLGRSHIPAGRLAVHPRLLGHLPQPRPRQPRPQHLTNLDHGNLPERHPPNPQVDRPGGIRNGQRSQPPARHAGWSHHWQPGGPMLVAEKPSERSHEGGRRHSSRQTWHRVCHPVQGPDCRRRWSGLLIACPRFVREIGPPCVARGGRDRHGMTSRPKPLRVLAGRAGRGCSDRRMSSNEALSLRVQAPVFQSARGLLDELADDRARPSRRCVTPSPCSTWREPWWFTRAFR
jgi:hypothetical protein